MITSLRSLLQRSRFWGLFLAFILILPSAFPQTGVPPAAGDGSSGDPYQIATLENLIWLREQTNSGPNISIGNHFIQTADIDMISISNWTPIGSGNMMFTSAVDQPNAFRGVYDGQNFAIRNLRINSSSSQRGLFGYAWDATIRNVRIENADVIVGEASGILIGQSAHWQSGTTSTPPVNIERVSVQGRLVSSGRRVGGIAGNPGMNTNITGQNVFIGEVTGTTDVGGLVGRASGSASVSFSYARAKVTGTNVGSSEGVGILVGNASTGAASFIEMYAEGEAIVTGGTVNRGAIGFAPQPGSGNHIVTDVWFDNAGGLVLIGNSGAPTPFWVTITGGGGLTTAQMQGASAASNMTGTGGRWNFSESGNWRTVSLPAPDYPVFTWQAGDEVTISGTVTATNASVEDITVRAQVGDATFQDVTTTTDASGDYSFNAYSTPTQRVFARSTDNSGLPIGGAVQGPWEESATVNLTLEPRSITISTGANNGWVRDGDEILAVEAGAVLNVNTLRDELLARDITVVAGVDVIFDADFTPALTAQRTLTLLAGNEIVFEDNAEINPSGQALNLILHADGLNLAVSARLKSSGSLTLVPRSPATTIGLGGATGTLQLPASYFSTNFEDGFESITIGGPDQTGDIAVGATVLRDPLTLWTTGAVTQTGSITGGQALTLRGTGGTHTLENAGNEVSQLTADTGSVSFVNAAALGLGAISAVGLIDVATLSGNLTLSGAVSTSKTDGVSLRLNAGRSASPPTTTGGNIIVGAGGSVSFGAGSTALLYTGEIAGSTGLTGLSGYDVSRVYYASDETTTLTPAPTDALYIVTREKGPQASIYVTLSTNPIGLLGTTTLWVTGGSGTGNFQIEVISGDENVTVTGYGPPWTITGDAAGTAQFRGRRLGDDTYLDSNWIQSLTLTITKGTPEIITLPSASFIRAGQALSASLLDGGAAVYLGDPVPGRFDWTDDSETPAAGTPDVSVTFTPNDGDNYNPVVFTIPLTVEAAPTHITLAAPDPATVAADATSGDFVLTIRDGDGNPVPAIEPVTFSLTSNSGSTGAAITLPATVTLERGESSATFTYRDQLAGTHTLTATYDAGDAGLSGFSDTADITVTPLGASQVTLDGPVGTFEVGTFTDDFTLTIRDVFGNPTALSEETVFTVQSAGSLYPDADYNGAGMVATSSPAVWTLAAGTVSETFTYSDNLAGTWSVFVNWESGDPGLDGLSVNAPATFTGATAAGITLSAPGASSAAGVPSDDFTLTVVDANGNASAPLAEPATFTLSTNSGSAAPAYAFSPATVTVLAGSNQATFTYMDEAAGNWQVTASYESGPAALSGATATANHTITGAAAHQIVFLNLPAGASVGSPTTLSVQIQDAFGNPSTVHGGFTNVVSVNQGWLDPSPVDISGSVSGVNLAWTPASAGTATLTASASGLAGDSASVDVILVADPVVSSTLAPTDIRPTMAVSGGNVSSDSGAPILVRGVVWSQTEENPTLASNDGLSRDGGAGIGSFYSTIDGLTPGETYHVRAYATNAQGTGYGPTQTFTTPAEIPEGPAVSYFTIEGVTLTVTARRSGYHANAYTFTLTPAEEPAGTPVRVVKDGDAFQVYARAGTATHTHVASALAANPYIASATVSHGSSALLALPQAQLSSAGVQAAFYEEADPPVGGSGGTFQISDYGTNSASGNWWYRGYIFNVSQTTEVTHLISAVTSGGSANVVLYRAGWNGSKVRGTELLGYVSGVAGTGSEVVTQLRLPNGNTGTVTLQTGQLYLLAQTAVSGSHVYVSNLNIPDLEGHPRIQSGSWQPTTNNSIRWDGGGSVNFLLNRDHYDYHGAMPRIGFLFESDVGFPVMQTQQGSLTGNQLTFNAILQRTDENVANAGQSTSLFIEYHTTPTVTSGTLAAASPAITTSDNTPFSHTINMASGQVYYYRGVAINERGRANSDLWRVGQTASGDFRFDPGTVLRVTGDNTRIGTQLRFDGSASAVSTSWNSSGNGTLTVNYVGGVTTFGEIRTAINTSGSGLQCGLLSGDVNAIPERSSAAMAEGYLELTITAENVTKRVDHEVIFSSTGGFTVVGLDNPSGLPEHSVDTVTLSSIAAPALAPAGGSVADSPYPITVSNAQGPGLDNYEIIYVDGEMTLLPGLPAEMLMYEQPTTTVAGAIVVGHPAVLVRDAWANPVLSGITVNVTAPLERIVSGSTLSAQTNAAGIATFDNLIIEQAGQAYTLEFTVVEAPED